MASTERTHREWQDLAVHAGRIFTPNTPISVRDLFAGRHEKIRRIVDVVNQDGQHAIIFGERGVGKTSLANVISQFSPTDESIPVLAPRINCDGGDTFDSVWRKVFEQIELNRTDTTAGFSPATISNFYKSSELLPNPATPDNVRQILTLLSRGATPILVIDEFDRLSQEPRRAFADTIKNLADHAVPATVVLVGVASSVEDLIREHESVSRALVQIQMPRMTSNETSEIVVNGIATLGMTITPSARDRIIQMSQGLPHYTHLLSLHAVRAAVDQRENQVTSGSVHEAVKRATNDAQQSIRAAYHAAVRSAHKEALFADVLLACAMAETDELGFFAAQDVRAPIRNITNRDYDIPTFAQHLSDFSDAKRGHILTRAGEKRRYRYRFSDPLMQPFALMQGVVDGRMPEPDKRT